MFFLLQTTQPTGWHDPNVVVGAIATGVLSLSGLIMGILAFIRGSKAQTTATSAAATAAGNTQAISDVKADVRSNCEQITSVAQNQMPPTAPKD